MTDLMPVDVAPMAPELLQAPSALSTPPAEPAQARVFAALMNGEPSPVASMGSHSNVLGAVAMNWAESLAKHPTPHEMHRSLMDLFDPNDLIKTQILMTEQSFHVTAAFTKLHIASNLASAATSLFGSLLKNA